MGSGRIESLLRAANSSPDNDSSVNVAKRVFLNGEDCEAFFQTVRSNLFRIEEWRKNSTVTTYDLFDESGRAVNSEPITEGKFIRIALHGSGKYDWVRVAEIHDEPAEVVMKVNPTYDPTSGDKASISHFFGPEAENSFCLSHDDKTVAFYVIGLREKQNAQFTSGAVETARNAAIANVGYYTGLQNAVWKGFALNFLRTEKEKAD